MSKFLKFIVHFLVICTILCVLALALPPFFGVTTVIMDSSEKATNLPMGSVTYAIPVRVDEVTVGTPILVQEDSKTYRYNLVNVNPDTSTGTVIDPSTSSEEGITVSVHNWVPKVVITVGYLGYLYVATQSLEGMMILGLVILFLVILYVIAELWKKEPEDEYEDYQGDTRHVKTEKELKAEEKAREKRMNKEDREFLDSEKERKKRAKKERKNRKKIHTGGFVDEIYEDDLEDEEPKTQPQKSTQVQAATTEAHEELKKEIAAATAEEPLPLEDAGSEKAPAATEIIPDLNDEEIQEPEELEEEEEEPVEIRKLAIPRYTASQLASKARKDGDAPDIVRDSITKVTLLDYSDIIAGEDDSEEEE